MVEVQSEHRMRHERQNVDPRDLRLRVAPLLAGLGSRMSGLDTRQFETEIVHLALLEKS